MIKNRMGLVSVIGAGLIGASSGNISQDKIPEAPVYSELEVPANYCSRYARFAAKDLYDINYPADDAWKLRNHDSVGTIRISEVSDLDKLVDECRLKPGMVVGMFYPKSKYNGREDVEKAGYTHVVLYVGKDEKAQLHFVDKFGSKTRRKTLGELHRDNKLVPKEIIYNKEHFNLSE